MTSRRIMSSFLNRMSLSLQSMRTSSNSAKNWRIRRDYLRSERDSLDKFSSRPTCCLDQRWKDSKSRRIWFRTTWSNALRSSWAGRSSARPWSSGSQTWETTKFGTGPTSTGDWTKFTSTSWPTTQMYRKRTTSIQKESASKSRSKSARPWARSQRSQRRRF